MTTGFQNKPILTIGWISLTAFLLFVALTSTPTIKGDGHYYYAMTYGFAENGSPALTEKVIAATKEKRPAATLEPLAFESRDGNKYAAHFWFYSLLSVPAFLLLNLLGLNNLGCFQLTNAIIISSTIFYILFCSKLNCWAKCFLLAAYLFSTAIIYFQWTHPEVFSASLLLLGSLAVLDKKYGSAALLVAVSSFQNPSIVLLLPFVVLSQVYDQYVTDAKKGLQNQFVKSLLTTCLIASVGIAQFLWYYYHSGTISVITNKGYIDNTLIGSQRLTSFIFDLNQGLIVGLPILIWAVPGALIMRALKAKNWTDLFHRNDILLLGFLVIILPTLAQTNWNAGHSVFLRYAAWAGMVVVAWVAGMVNRLPKHSVLLVVVPGIIIQIVASNQYGGMSYRRSSEYAEFKPWTGPIWEISPNFYNPDQEIFWERLNVNVRGTPIETPAIYADNNSHYLKVLTRNSSLETVSKNICGEQNILSAIDSRKSSEPKFVTLNRGYYYLNGRLSCYMKLSEDWNRVDLTKENFQNTQNILASGWQQPESRVTWSSSTASTIELEIDATDTNEVEIGFEGRAYVESYYPTQRIVVQLDGEIVGDWDINYPKDRLTPEEHHIRVSTKAFVNNKLRLKLQFPDAISPTEAGSSSPDSRVLALGLTSLHARKSK